MVEKLEKITIYLSQSYKLMDGNKFYQKKENDNLKIDLEYQNRSVDYDCTQCNCQSCNCNVM